MQGAQTKVNISFDVRQWLWLVDVCDKHYSRCHQNVQYRVYKKQKYRMYRRRNQSKKKKSRMYKKGILSKKQKYRMYEKVFQEPLMNTNTHKRGPPAEKSQRSHMGGF